METILVERLTLAIWIRLFYPDSSCSQSSPDAHFDLFLFINLLEDESHGVEEDDSTDKGEDLDDGFEEETNIGKLFVEGIGRDHLEITRSVLHSFVHGWNFEF